MAMRAHLRSGQHTRQQVTKKQRTNRMLMAVTVIFVGCWLPLNVIHITFDYYEKVGQILAGDAQLALIVAQCLSIHLSISCRRS